ncbi:FecR family protein [Vreelandella olivaria]|uniref:FecR family protein n=1 Tax=Vreelandella olivaria TaxID=390919 RepID=UPI00201EC11A
MTTSSTSTSDSARSSQLDEELLDTAIRWHLRLKDDSASDQDRHSFQAWMNQSEHHVVAYQNAIQLWEEIELPALLLYQQRHQQRARPRSLPHRPQKRSMRWGWATAAVLMLTMLLGFEFWRDPARMDRWMADMSTPPGQLQRTLLEDGSTLLLDGNSAIDITMNATGRELFLRRGRLWMDAAQQQRPLLINAGEVSILVLGTHFSVSRFHSRTTITVGEGAVTVSDAQHRQTLLSAGQQLTVQNGEFGDIQEVDPLLALAWKEGRIIFNQASIDDIVEQLERMHPGRILFNAQEFAELSFSGSFPANQPDTLIDTLVDLAVMEAHYLPGEMLWLRATSTS